MDGGGRIFGSVTARGGGGASARPLAQGGASASAPIPAFPLSAGAERRRSRLDRIARALPRFSGSLLLSAFAGIVALVGLGFGGQIDAYLEENGAPRDIAARAVGFGIEAVTISGIARLHETEVLAAAGISSKSSLPFLDVAIAREGLESLPLVASASVRKLFPNRVSIALVEREPYALWQVEGQVYVIAADGAVIDLFRDDPRYAALPLVVGEAANERLEDYFALVDAAGALRDRIRAGTLVAERRWTLQLDNGLDVRLPEQDPMAALQRLVRLEQRYGLTGKDIIAVDLRIPDRVVVRLTEDAASARTESLRGRPMRGRGVRT